MANVYRYKALLSGFSGAPGITLFHARFSAVPILEDYQGFANDVRACYSTLANYLKAGLTIDIHPDVEVFDDATGTLQTVAAITPPARVTGSGGSGRTSHADMICVQLRTDAIVRGRRLRGRHFHGPLDSLDIRADGTMDPVVTAAVTNAYNGLLDVAHGRLVVWSRPTPVEDGDDSRVAPNNADGSSGFVQNVGVMGVPAVLRSRRD